ncbi:MAG: two-component regulator propeller domain-containing protein [Blastocatellales bacterium]
MFVPSPQFYPAIDRRRVGFGVIVLIILIQMIAPDESHARQVRFHRLSIGQGLLVKAIVQDQRGLMWFGTMDGLYRYDGYSFTLYRHDPRDAGSLSDNDIRALFLDREGQLWAGTRKAGLNRFDYLTERFTRFKHDPANPDSLSGDIVLAIHEDRSGKLWIGTYGGLDLYDRATGRFIHHPRKQERQDAQAIRYIRAIAQDQAGMLWVGTALGLYRYDPDTGNVRHLTSEATDPGSLIHNSVLSLCADQSGMLWVGTENGLDRYDPATGRFTHFRSDPNDQSALSGDQVDVIYEDRAGQIWIGTDSLGLNQFDRATGRFIRHRSDPANPDSLSSDLVHAIYEDRSGILWFGADGGMLNRYQPASSQFVHFRHNPKDPASLGQGWVRGIADDQFGHIWLGLEGGGLSRFDPTTGRFTNHRYDPSNPDSPASDTIWFVYRDRMNMIWLGLMYALDRVNPASGQFRHFKSDLTDPHSLSRSYVNTIHEDSSGMLWIGLEGGGLDQYDRTTGHFRRFRYDPSNPRGVSHGEVECIYEDRAGALWIGTGGGGLNRYDRQTGSFKHYLPDPDNPRSLSHSEVRSIFEARDGALWIGTEGGLNLFDRQTGSFTRFTVREGLPNDTINNILEDDQGNLWLATNKGLSRFDPRTRTFRNYDADDGLNSYHFTGSVAYRAPNGEMYFGANDGLIRFRPDQIRDSAFRPQIVLTAFRKFGRAFKLQQSLTETREINLSWRDYVFSLEFAALDFSSPNRNQYAYKLEGFDPDWIQSGTQRTATFTNLPGGDYVFRVRGTNSDGVWSDQELAVRISVTSPPWKTWWAYALYALALAGAIGGAVTYRLRQLQNVNEARKQFTEQLITSQEVERKRIAAELHDGLGQSLLVIKNRATISKRIANGDDRLTAQLDEISRATGQALTEVRGIAYNLRPYHLERLGLRESIEAMIEQIREATGLEINARVALFDEAFSKDDEVLFYRVIQECMNNIIKHANATAVEISIVQTETEVTAQIRDNGRGFPVAPEKQTGGFGLIGMAERVRMLGGRQVIASEPGKGTTVTVRIPRRDE